MRTHSSPVNCSETIICGLCVRLGIVALLAWGLTVAIPVARGDITYTLHLGSSTEENQVAASVAEGAQIYNTYGSFNKHWDVYYNSGIPTAEANYAGYMGYGSQRTTRTVLHEGAHTLGMGQYNGDTGPSYFALIDSGWDGEYGQQAVQDTYGGALAGDYHAIWPGGMNYENEFTDNWIHRVWMVRVQAGMRCDEGIMAYNREAENELVHPGETAVFHVASPVATSYQWYKGGIALANGGDISGADTDTLLIANAEAADEGSYYCAATGANETLNSRARLLFIDPAQPLGQWDMEGNVSDSVNTNHGTAYGSPAYTDGKVGLAIDLDGVNDYVALPPAIGFAKDITVAAWVNWDGGSNWQRIFDFGTGTYQNMFLTPNNGSEMRLAFKDAVNGVSTEQQIDTTALPTGTWVHLAAVLHGGYATLYVNGQAAGSTAVPVTDPIDFLPSQNYIGKSQWPDALFNGRIDDFRVYNYALDGSDVWNLWGQSGNAAPVFETNTVVFPSICAGYPYAAPSLMDYVYDADDGVSVTISKIDGPAWLSVAADGTLSGTPGPDDAGRNVAHVRVEDPSGASSDMEIQIAVMIDFTQGPIAYWDFNDAGLGATNGAAVPDSDGNAVWREAATDQSGNANHLTTWEHAWAGFNWSSFSDRGDLSIVAAGSYPAAYTWSEQSAPVGIDMETVVLSNFTVEALTTTSGSGFRTVVGRDARHVSASDQSLAAFYLGLNPDNHPLARMTDNYGQTAEVIATGVTVPNDDSTWYHLAAVRQGDVLKLYVNGVEEASTQVVGLGALANGTLNHLDWHKGGWSVGRGLYAGAHGDRWFGHIDAVAVSGVALAPGQFVITGLWPSGYEFYVTDYGIPGESFAGDWNTNGIPNGMEYFLGWDPTDPFATNRAMSWAPDFQSATYPFNKYASGVTGSVEWTGDLMSSNWYSSGISYVTNSYPSEIEATFTTAVSNQMFIRLKVTQ